MLAVSSFCKGYCTGIFFVRRLDILDEMTCAAVGAATRKRSADTVIDLPQYFLQYRFSSVVMVNNFT